MQRRNTPTGHPEIWAILTIIAFPIVLLSGETFGLSWAISFGLALLSSFVILCLEALTRGRTWLFEKPFENFLSHPELPFRMIIFVGALLLILESALILVIATDKNFNEQLIGLALHKQCFSKNRESNSRLCAYFKKSEDGFVKQNFNLEDMESLAIRNAAAKAWFPDDNLVTCADRKLERTTYGSNGCINLSIVHCTAWGVNANGVLQAKGSATKYAAAVITPNTDGTRSVIYFSDNTNDPNWKNMMGDSAQKFSDLFYSIPITSDFISALQAEALGRAQTLLR